MTGYILRRVLWAFGLFFAITIAAYVIFFVIPSEPGRIGRGQSSEPTDLRNSLGIRGPIYEEYGKFVWRVGHGSFGQSWQIRRDVNKMILEAAPVTLSLVFGAAVFWLLIAVPVGILSALRPRSLLDRFATIGVLLGISVHPVWIGLILSYLLGYQSRIFPLGGYCDLFSPSTRCGGPTQWAYHLLLPWFTFALLYAALYMRMIRANVVETMNEEYVRTARAKGAPEWIVLRSHVLRNAMLPVVTMLGMDFGVWMGNAIFVERVYGLPGIGGLLFASLGRRDLPVILAIVVFVALTVALFNLITDLLYAAIDPRIRLVQGDFEGSATEPHRAPVARSAEQTA